MKIGCDETSHRTAARAHGVIVTLYTVTGITLGAALCVLGVMVHFHRVSVRTHEQRAIEAGE